MTFVLSIFLITSLVPSMSEARDYCPKKTLSKRGTYLFVPAGIEMAVEVRSRGLVKVKNADWSPYRSNKPTKLVKIPPSRRNRTFWLLSYPRHTRARVEACWW